RTDFGLGVIHPAAFLIVIAAAFFAVRQIISRALSDSDSTITTIGYTALVGSALLTLPLPFVWTSPNGQEIIIMAGNVDWVTLTSQIGQGASF
ncbi:unnamed protein product, partial [marine sediment metagenome]